MALVLGKEDSGLGHSHFIFLSVIPSKHTIIDLFSFSYFS